MSSYATIANFNSFGLPAGIIASISSANQQLALDSASDLADSYLGAHYRLPLTSWGNDLRRAVCHIAMLDLLMVRGFNPEDPTDKLVSIRAERAEAWLKLIADGMVTPIVQDSSTGLTPDQGSTFVGQLQIIPPPNTPVLSLNGAAPSLVDSAPAILQVGPPILRGW